MSKTLEQIIQESVTEVLSGDSFQTMVQEALQKEIKKSIENAFGYGGEAKKLLDSKIKEVIVPAIERHDFNNYLVKVENVLTDIVNSTNLVDNKVILDNFKDLMCEEELKLGTEINITTIFEQWGSYVERTIEGHHLDARFDDGEPYYAAIEVKMEVIPQDKYFSSIFDDVTVRFICEEDKDLNFEMKLYKYANKNEHYNILATTFSDNIADLRNLDEFEIFISKIKRAQCKVVVDKENDTMELTEFEAKPEWTLE